MADYINALIVLFYLLSVIFCVNFLHVKETLSISESDLSRDSMTFNCHVGRQLTSALLPGSEGWCLPKEEWILARFFGLKCSHAEFTHRQVTSRTVT